MARLAIGSIMVIALLFAIPALAAPGKLTVTLEGLETGKKLPVSAAFCAPPSLADADHNISPAVSWSKGPDGTRSYVLIMTDLDVPKDLSLINKPGVTIPADAPRMPFIHWILVDIPPSIDHLAKGVESAGFVPKGNPVGPTDHGVRGANVYSNFYPKDSPLAGPHGGYDGPCPPKNDPVSHRYVTDVYALDIKSLGLKGVFFGEAALNKMKGHILAHGRADALYGGTQ
jgi:Raf kinase inhibitor-like YbhB/YbcL family protein